MNSQSTRDSGGKLSRFVLGTGLAWAVFVSGILLGFGVDAMVRLANKTQAAPGEAGSIVPRHGLSDDVLISFFWLVSGLSLVILWKATGAIKRRWIQVPIVLLQLGLGFVLLCIIDIAYTIETGIDSL